MEGMRTRPVKVRVGVLGWCGVGWWGRESGEGDVEVVGGVRRALKWAIMSRVLCGWEEMC